MLSYLHVTNIALIQEVEIEFNNGLNVITGETGAGKSILVGAINAVLGNKMSKDFIRAGEKSAHIELIFSDYNPLVNVILETLEIDIEDELIISRKLGNRSVFRINGTIVNASSVKMVADALIDVHSQHEHQSLLDQKNHIQLLDRFLDNELSHLMSAHKDFYKNYQKVIKELGSEDLNESDKQREIDFLEFEINEIEQLNIDIEADKVLDEDYKRYMKAGEIVQAISRAHSAIKSEDDGLSAAELVDTAMRELNVVDQDTDVASIYSQLDSISLQLDNVSHDMTTYVDRLDIDPGTLQEMTLRVDALNKIRMKHGRSLEAVLEVLSEKKDALKKLLDFEQYKMQLAQKKEGLESEMLVICKQMTDVRKAGAAKIQKSIVKQLQGLNLLDSKFEIEIKERGKIGVDGMDIVTFMITTNIGAPLKPLAKVASGGEVSRVMLAIKSVLASVDTVDTMIFDEIDVGISGMTAQLVGERLGEVSKDKQIITITHLPQIAAMADHHYQIVKYPNEDSVTVAVNQLNDDEMIEEVARLLSGKAVTETVMQNARELKAQAKS